MIKGKHTKGNKTQISNYFAERVDKEIENRTKSKNLEEVKIKKIIKNKKVFSPNHIPKNILHRGYIIDKLISHFIDTVDGTWCGDLSIYGKTGTGKTLITKLLFSTLSNRTKTTYYVYVSCEEQKTPTGIYQSILSQITKEKISKGMSMSYYINELKERVINRLLVIVFDEIDTFLIRNKTYQDLIYIFADWDNVVTIFISNDPSWHRLLTDHRIQSRLHLENMIFNTYSKAQIFDILIDRAKLGLNEGTYDDGTVDKIAEFAANHDGDARIGIRLLFLTSKHAEDEWLEKISSYDLEEATKLLEEDNTIQFILSLSPLLKILLIAIYQANRPFRVPSLDVVYREYTRLIPKCDIELPILAKNTIRKYIDELITYNLVEKKVGKGRGKNRGREPTKIFLTFDIKNFEKKVLVPMTQPRIDKYGDD